MLTIMKQSRRVLLLSLALLSGFTVTKQDDTLSERYKSAPQVRNLSVLADQITDFVEETQPFTSSAKRIPAGNPQVIQDIKVQSIKPSGDKNSAYTITADEFAEKTSSAKLNKEEKGKKNSGFLLNEVALDIKPIFSKNNLYNSNGTLSTSNNSKNNFTNLNVSSDFNIVTSVNENTNISKSNFFTLSEIERNVSNRLKALGKNLDIIWRNMINEACRTSEAASVLQDYRDKIAISEAANLTDCVKSDLEKYVNRKESLKEVFHTCEQNVEKEDWKALQQMIRDTIDNASNVVREATISKSTLSKLSQDFEEKVSTIENKAKLKLEHISDGVVGKYHEVEIKLLPVYEKQYRKCIEEATQHGIVDDTLNDIMRMKNNCVG
ncbi:repetitive organellar protein-like [Homalodisca vitripennis]|uniref:repetitive organellar protein-like n=1 Tax=Homalodisca vitripennis TaxID=197043 RepID=UPI001EEBFF3C|nr:repetitive organellar protein-like [Homalodisca vitripennis]